MLRCHGALTRERSLFCSRVPYRVRVYRRAAERRWLRGTRYRRSRMNALLTALAIALPALVVLSVRRRSALGILTSSAAYAALIVAAQVVYAIG